MTAQRGESIKYKGNMHIMASEPLEQYLAKLQDKPKLDAPNSGLWRGYVGSWELREDKLFLIELTCFSGTVKRDIEYIFPDENCVFANWFTGLIRIPTGELLQYIHGGYDSVYEKDIFLDFEKGILKDTTFKENIFDESMLVEREMPF